MKAVPKVNTDGLLIDEAIMDDIFSGVVPFYNHSTPVSTDPQQEEDSSQLVIAGYTVGIPVTPGLYHPRFDLDGWGKYQDAVSKSKSAYENEMNEWSAQDEENRGDQPVYVPPQMPNLWIEGLTQEEIAELLKPPEPTELDRIKESVAKIQLQSSEQQQTLGTIGSEQVKHDLTALDLKQQNNVIGAELVKKDISILDLYMQNQVLGQMLAALELKLLAGKENGNV